MSKAGGRELFTEKRGNILCARFVSRVDGQERGCNNRGGASSYGSKTVSRRVA
jgi:hypothetical protein